MTTHSHDIGCQWPFEDAENTACFTCSHVLEEQHSILRVAHDEDDGAWQFLCGQSHELEQARVVCLGCMIVSDRELASLADLPLGWCAERTCVGSAWVREQTQSESERDDDAG
jgi:hypothetical protein